LTGVSSVGILAEGELDFTAVNTFMMKLLQVIVFRVEQCVLVS
jgi:uncharacterized protein YaiE (UPF0345 family)